MAQQIVNNGDTGLVVRTKWNANDTELYAKDATQDTAIALNTAKVTYDSTSSTKVAFISVTQAVDLDTMESDISTNASDITALENAGNFETTAASKTIGLADINKNLKCTGATVITVPPASTTDFADNDIVVISQDGAGEVSVLAGAGVTIKSLSGNLKLAGQYASAYLQNESGDLWWLIGALKA